MSKGPADAGRFEVAVNGDFVTPYYLDVNKALARAEKEARTKRYVAVYRTFTDRPPKLVRYWEGGQEQ